MEREVKTTAIEGRRAYAREGLFQGDVLSAAARGTRELGERGCFFMMFNSDAQAREGILMSWDDVPIVPPRVCYPLKTEDGRDNHRLPFVPLTLVQKLEASMPIRKTAARHSKDAAVTYFVILHGGPEERFTSSWFALRRVPKDRSCYISPPTSSGPSPTIEAEATPLGLLEEWLNITRGAKEAAPDENGECHHLLAFLGVHDWGFNSSDVQSLGRDLGERLRKWRSSRAGKRYSLDRDWKLLDSTELLARDLDLFNALILPFAARIVEIHEDMSVVAPARWNESRAARRRDLRCSFEAFQRFLEHRSALLQHGGLLHPVCPVCGDLRLNGYATCRCEVAARRSPCDGTPGEPCDGTPGEPPAENEGGGAPGHLDATARALNAVVRGSREQRRHGAGHATTWTGAAKESAGTTSKVTSAAPPQSRELRRKSKALPSTRRTSQEEPWLRRALEAAFDAARRPDAAPQDDPSPPMSASRTSTSRRQRAQQRPGGKQEKLAPAVVAQLFLRDDAGQ
jgi:hypothetical protein